MPHVVVLEGVRRGLGVVDWRRRRSVVRRRGRRRVVRRRGRPVMRSGRGVVRVGKMVRRVVHGDLLVDLRAWGESGDLVRVVGGAKVGEERRLGDGLDLGAGVVVVEHQGGLLGDGGEERGGGGVERGQGGRLVPHVVVLEGVRRGLGVVDDVGHRGGVNGDVGQPGGGGGVDHHGGVGGEVDVQGVAGGVGGDGGKGEGVLVGEGSGGLVVDWWRRRRRWRRWVVCRDDVLRVRHRVVWLRRVVDLRRVVKLRDVMRHWVGRRVESARVVLAEEILGQLDFLFLRGERKYVRKTI